MLPTLAANDPDPARRRAEIHANRELYRYAHLFPSSALPSGVAVAEEVPPLEGFPPAELAQVVATEALVVANLLASDFARAVEGLTEGPSASDALMVGRVATETRLLFAAPAAVARRLPDTRPPTTADYKRLFTLIRAPEIVGVLDRGPAVQDRAFAYERVAGAGPLALHGITKPRTGPVQAEPTCVNGYPVATPAGELPATFALDEATYQRAMGPGDSLAAAIAERRLYVADYRMLHGLPNSTWRAGRPRYGYAPIAAFAVQRSTRERLGQLVPVAIQCEQAHGGTRANPVFTPKDGVRWKMARTVVQSADGQLQELVFHLARTHLVMEAAVVAARRSFAPAHPLFVLLQPHFQSTLTINDHAVHSLIAPGGQVEELFSKTLAGSLELATRGLAELDVRALAPTVDATRRLVEDRVALPDYPFRDDANELWPAMLRFVTRYCRLYYASAADVISDRELRAFVESLASPDEGGLRHVPRPQTIDELAHFIASLVWTASAQHSSMNYAQFPMMGYVVNVPGALYAQAPTADTPQNDAEWQAMLPPSYLAASQFGTLYELSGVRTSTLGRYPTLTFVDRRVEPILADYQADLERIETFVTGVDGTRLLSYPYLRPSQIGQSVFI